MRQTVSTFLMNTARAHTVFRALMEGPDGGFQGPVDAIVLAYENGASCSAAVAVLPNRYWYLHGLNGVALAKIIDSVPRQLKPLKIHGEPDSVRRALEHPR
ncbi:MAG TPA: hypothetical protein ENN67_08840, partial [Firmicutes bacterium]|nr:hypothetical protein [Bacillota bacterium]